jgi:very-short-patch-repair endonuclease
MNYFVGVFMLEKYLNKQGGLNSNVLSSFSEDREMVESYLGVRKGLSAMTLIAGVIHGEIPTCKVCGDVFDRLNFKKGSFGSTCSLKCKYEYSATKDSSLPILEDFSILYDQNGNLSWSKVDKFLSKATVDSLKEKHDFNDIKTLLQIEKYGSELIRKCKECGDIIPVHNVSQTPYGKSIADFCSVDCKDANLEYRDNIRQQRLGSRKLNDTYNQNVAIPWFKEKVSLLETTCNIKCLDTVEKYIESDIRYQKYNWKCNCCSTEFSASILSKKELFCPKCNIRSVPQKRIVDMLQNAGFNCLVNDRTLIAPYELDIVVPEKNIAIEYDGLYFHRDKDDYHKKVMCDSIGIRLIKIFDDENEDIVYSRLRSIFGITEKKIHARKCSVIELTETECREFIETNHIQGWCQSKHRYGLIHSGELVAVMTFGLSRFNKEYQYELLRFCSLNDTNVIGGASKLLKHFMSSAKPDSIISYCDLRWGTGKLYENMGFTELKQTEQGFSWYKGGKRYSRMTFQRWKLIEKYPEFSSMKTEDIMVQLGYSKIYDFGNKVYGIKK